MQKDEFNNLYDEDNDEIDENVYTHMGMLFSRIIVSEHIILVPYNVARCNIVDEFNYDVEGIGETESCFVNSMDIDELSIGFVVPINDIKKKANNWEQALRIYRNEITDYIYIQIADEENDTKITYRFDLFNNSLSKFCEFKENAISFRKSELTFTTNNKTNIYTPPIIDKTSKSLEPTKNKESTSLNIKKLYYALKENIIGQDEAIKQIIPTLDRNFNIKNYRNKTNILLIGPSGSGKTEIFRTIEEVLNIPITIEDSEQYSAVGYQGANISDMLVKLYFKANCDINKAEHGILVIDEIDKKVSNDKDDVSGTRILSSLLSLMEGTNFRINIGSEDDPEYIDFNTNYLTVVLVGAFSDIFDKSSSIGFNNNIEKDKKDYQQINKKKLNEYGLSDENLRRVSIYRLNELSIENLYEILNNSKNSALTEYINYSKSKNVTLNITKSAKYIIAKRAYDKKIGASGIKDTLNEILNDAFFEISMEPDLYKGIKITAQSLNSVPPYILVKKENHK